MVIYHIRGCEEYKMPVKMSERVKFLKILIGISSRKVMKIIKLKIWSDLTFTNKCIRKGTAKFCINTVFLSKELIPKKNIEIF